MSRQLHIDLLFNANTSGAKAQIQSLQQSMNQLTTSMASQGAQFGLTPQLQQAQQAAVQLRTALQQSLNVNTGQFDLTKFSSSLKSMGTNLSMLKTQLTSVGPTGQQAFMSLAQSIMAAEIPTKRISASLMSLGTTLKNTLKWQLSSSMLHGFMGAVQTSFQYAQDLNESLNNIRIVTDQSAAAMDKFAERANKAAKELSASTLEYTKAALIYYQQGLDDKEVEERTNVTIKMANVSRQSAEVVSDQMTAIWNNFDNGTKSLEYYADAMTALGAATASSTDEIAGGLEKFAAIADTIGLSYEYAAAALATITSNTRESETVVGTALKTIFARIQGLKLGETLEDGVELNKYSEALEAIGVDVLDVNGNLVDANTILDKTAEKWKTLSREQKSATAQTVAGIRQYNQFIALMDNWDDGTSDSMKANLETVENSAGALQRQADIYAESWEAANKRVKASAEAIYTTLIDDDFFIDMANGFSDLLDKTKVFLDTIGGVKGVLLALSGVLLNTFSGAAAQGLENMIYNLRSFIGLTQMDATKLQTQMASMTMNLGTTMPLNNYQQGQLFSSQQQVGLQQQINQLSSQWTNEQKLQADNIVYMNKLLGEQVALLGQEADVAEKEQSDSKMLMLEQTLGTTRQFQHSLDSIDNDIDFSSNIIKQADQIEQEFIEGKIGITEYANAMRSLAKDASKLPGLSEDLKNASMLNENNIKNPTYKEDRHNKRQIIARDDIINKNSYNPNESRVNRGMRGVETEAIEGYIRNTQTANEKALQFAAGQESLKAATKAAETQLQQLNNTSRSWSQTVVGVASGVSSLGFGISSLKNMFETLNNTEVSFGDKIISAMTGLGMALPMVINGFNTLTTAIAGTNAVKLLAIGLGAKEITTLGAIGLAKAANISLEAANFIMQKSLTAQNIVRQFTEGEINKELAIKNLQTLLNIDAETAELVLTGKITIAEVLRNKGLKLSILNLVKHTAKTIANTAAQVAWNIAKAIGNALLGNFGGLILIATLGVVGITAATLANAKAQEVENEKLAEANEKLQNAERAYNAATQAVKEFNDALNEYNDTVDKLAEMKKGTEEYTEALKKANDEAREMLRIFPDLDYTIQDGVITFTNKQQINEAKDYLQNTAEYMSRNLTVAQSEQKIQQERTRVYNENNKIYDNGFGRGWVADTFTRQEKTDFLTNLYQLPEDEREKILNVEQWERQALEKEGHNVTGVNAEKVPEYILDFLYNSSQNKTAREENPYNKYDPNGYALQELINSIKNIPKDTKVEILENASEMSNAKRTAGDFVEADVQGRYGVEFEDKYGAAEIFAAEQKHIDDWYAQLGNKSYINEDIVQDQTISPESYELLDEATKQVLNIMGITEDQLGEKTHLEIEDDQIKITGLEGEQKETSQSRATVEAAIAMQQGEFNFPTEEEIAHIIATGVNINTELFDEGDRKVVQSDFVTEEFHRGETGSQEEVLKDYYAYAGITKEQLEELKEKNFLTDSDIRNAFADLPQEMREDFAENLLKFEGEVSKDNLENLKTQTKEKKVDAYIDSKAAKQAGDFGLDPKILRETAKEYNKLAKAGDKAYKSLENNSEALVDAATNYMRLNRGISTIRQDTNKYVSTLQRLKTTNDAGEKISLKFSDAMSELRTAISDVLNTSEELVDVDFLETLNPKDIEAAANGSIDAVNRIRDSFIDYQIQGVESFNKTDEEISKFKSALAGLEDGAKLDIDTAAFLQQLINAKIAAGASATDIANMLTGMGISFDMEELSGDLTTATAAAAEAGDLIAKNVGTDIEMQTATAVSEETKTMPPSWYSTVKFGSEQPQTWYAVEASGDGETVTQKEYKIGGPSLSQEVHAGKKGPVAKTQSETKGVGVKATNPATGTSTGGGVKFTDLRKVSGSKIAPPSVTNPGGGGKGGGGGSSGPAKRLRPKKKYEINDKSGRSGEELDRALKRLEDSFGTDKFDEMYQNYFTLKEEHVTNLAEKGQEAKQALIDIFAEKGLVIEFDQDGTIKNFDEMFGILTDQLEGYYRYYSDPLNFTNSEDQEAWKKAFIDPLEEIVNEAKKYRDDYVGVLDEMYELRKPAKKQKVPKKYELYDNTKDSERKVEKDRKKLDNTTSFKDFDKNYRRYEQSTRTHVKNLNNIVTQSQQGITEKLGEKKIALEFDSDGAISNLDSVKDTIVNKLSELYEFYADPNNFVDAEAQELWKQGNIDMYEEWLDEVLQYIEDYENAKDNIEDLAWPDVDPIEFDVFAELEISAELYDLHAQQAAEAIESARRSADEMAKSVEFAADSLYGIAGLDLSMTVFDIRRAGAKNVYNLTASAEDSNIQKANSRLDDIGDKTFPSYLNGSTINSFSDILKSQYGVDKPLREFSTDDVYGLKLGVENKKGRVSSEANTITHLAHLIAQGDVVVTSIEDLKSENIKTKVVNMGQVNPDDYDALVTGQGILIGPDYLSDIINSGNWGFAAEGLNSHALSVIGEYEQTTDYLSQALDETTKKDESTRNIRAAGDEYATEMADIDREEVQRAAEVTREKYSFTSEILDLFQEIKNAQANQYDEDDIYSTVERAATLYGTPTYTTDASGKITSISDAGMGYEVPYQKIQASLQTVALARAQLAAGEIQDSRFNEILVEQGQIIFENKEAMLQYVKEAGNLYLDFIPKAAAELDKYDKKLKSHTDLLNFYKNTLSLIGRKNDYKTIGAILSGQEKMINSDLSKARKELAWWQAQEADLTKKMQAAQQEKGADSAEFKQLEKELLAVQDNVLKTEEEIQSLLTTLGNTAMEKFKAQVQEAREILEDQLTNELGFDVLLKDLERLSSRQNEYLTKTNQAYETTTLMRKTWQAMDKTDNVAAKKKYAAFNTYLEGLAQQGELSEYELNIAKQKFDLMQAEIALEEARNAKNQVRLQRDSEGNFGYVYTANKEATDKAEQAVYDAQNKMYNTSVDTLEKLRSQIYNIRKQAMDDITALSEKAIEEGWSKEKLEAETKKVIDNATKQNNRLVGLYNKARTDAEEFMSFGNNQTIYGVSTDILNGAYDDLNAFTLEWDATVGGVAEHEKIYFQEMTLDAQDFEADLNNYLTSIAADFDEWKGSIQPVVDEVGGSYEDTAKKVQGATEQHENYITVVTDPEKGVLKTVNDETYEVTLLARAWQSVSQAITDTAEGYGKVGTGLITEAYKKSGVKPTSDANPEDNIVDQENDAKYYLQERNQYVVGSAGYTKYDKLFKAQDDWWKEVEDIGTEIINYAEYMTEHHPDVAWYLTDDFKILMGGIMEKRASDSKYKIDYNEVAKKYGSDDIRHWVYQAMANFIKDAEENKALKKSNTNSNIPRDPYDSYDTGGYTGDWGPEGKMAMLHEKELVLNKQDTVNFLTATEILRDINQMLDRNAIAAQLGMIDLKAMTVNNQADQILQQEVTIHADFPNVTDHNEIELAMSNLINAASQYANREF